LALRSKETLAAFGETLAYRSRLRIEGFVLCPIVEGKAIDVANECLRRRVLCEDHRVIVEFNMIVGKRFRDLGLALDRSAVDA
jgi:hypothetical protein